METKPQTEVNTSSVKSTKQPKASPFIQDKPYISDDEYIDLLQEKIPNFPIKFWQKAKGKSLAKNKSCAKFPNFYEISFNNLYWQNLKTSNGSFYLYGAYYDNRSLVNMKPIIRILGMIDRIKPEVKTNCQLWFDGHKKPVFSMVSEYKYIWFRKWGNYKQGLPQPYLISCQIPKDFRTKIPQSVSLVEKTCDTSSTNLRVIYNPAKDEKKEDFAVCVKGLDFLRADLSTRLVEWLETLFILGAHKVYMYNFEIHPNISKVLKYYESIGRVELTPLTLPGEQPNLPGLIHMYLEKKLTHKRQNEVIPYNDCLYKNMYRYKFIALLDTDEVIMPKSVNSWTELLKLALQKDFAKKKSPRASYNVRNVYFMDTMLHDHGWFENIPHYMHMLQHVYRSVKHTKPGYYVKCFHNPERVLLLHNHFPLACIGGGCSSYSIPINDAQLQHYREGCPSELKKSCASEYKINTQLDSSIWKYKETLIDRVTNTLRTLGFVESFSNLTLESNKIQTQEN